MLVWIINLICVRIISVQSHIYNFKNEMPDLWREYNKPFASFIFFFFHVPSLELQFRRCYAVLEHTDKPLHIGGNQLFFNYIISILVSFGLSLIQFFCKFYKYYFNQWYFYLCKRISRYFNENLSKITKITIEFVFETIFHCGENSTGFWPWNVIRLI